MRRAQIAVTIATTLMTYQAMANVASAKPTRARASIARVGVRVSEGPWSASLQPAGTLKLRQTAFSGSTPVINGDTAAFVGGPVVYMYSEPAAGWSAATPGSYQLPADQVQDSPFAIAAGRGVVALAGTNAERQPTQAAR